MGLGVLKQLATGGFLNIFTCVGDLKCQGPLVLARIVVSDIITFSKQEVFNSIIRAGITTFEATLTLVYF